MESTLYLTNGKRRSSVILSSLGMSSTSITDEMRKNVRWVLLKTTQPLRSRCLLDNILERLSLTLRGLTSNGKRQI